MGKTKKVAISALAAGVAGYLTGILTAPKSGKETREDIKQAASKAVTEAEKNLKKLHGELTELIDQGKLQTGKLKDKTTTELNDAILKAGAAKDKARQLLTALHAGDADDKDLKQAVAEIKNAMDHLKAYLKKAS